MTSKWAWLDVPVGEGSGTLLMLELQDMSSNCMPTCTHLVHCQIGVGKGGGSCCGHAKKQEVVLLDQVFFFPLSSYFLRKTLKCDDKRVISCEH